MPRRLALYISAVLSMLILAEFAIPLNSGEAGASAPGAAPHWRSLNEITAAPDFPTAHLTQAPLFDPSRRSADVEASAPPPPPPPMLGGEIRIMDRLTLLGVVDTGSERFAIVLDRDGQQVSRVAAGATIAGWRVDRILADSVILAAGQETEEVRFRYGPPPH